MSKLTPPPPHPKGQQEKRMRQDKGDSGGREGGVETKGMLCREEGWGGGGVASTSGLLLTFRSIFLFFGLDHLPTHRSQFGCKIPPGDLVEIPAGLPETGQQEEKFVFWGGGGRRGVGGGEGWRGGFKKNLEAKGRRGEGGRGNK